MIDFSFVLKVIWVHTWSDWILQPRHVALNKSNHFGAWLQHIGVVAIGLCLIAFTTEAGWLWWIINVLAHGFQDAIIWRIAAVMPKWKDNKVLNDSTFVWVAIDQFFHYNVMFGTYYVLHGWR